MHPDTDATITDECAAAAVIFGMVSLLTCWWFPFGATLGAVGTACGLGAWWLGRDGGRAAVGTVLSAVGTATGVALGWSYWMRVLA